MGKLQNYLDAITQKALDQADIERAALKRALKNKGFRLTMRQMDRFMAAVADFKEGTPFPDDLPGMPTDVDLTDEDLEKAVEGLRAEIKAIQLKAMEKLLSKEPAKLATAIRKRAKEPVSDGREHRDRFHRDLERLWRKGFLALELLLGCVREIGGQLLEEWSEQEAANPSSEEARELTMVLRDLHIKSCRIADEVVCLLKGGFADGANARWRSLHELAVIASFIATNGGDLPRRYRDHAIWERWRATKDYQNHYVALGQDPYAASELDDMEKAKDVVIAKYGTAFASECGWAASVLPPGQGGFSKIEKHAGLAHWRPYYQMACHAIHGGAQGLNFALGALDDSEFPLSGASDLGLMDPAQCTSLSITLISCAFFLHRPDLDSMVATKVVQILGEDVITAFAQTHHKLEALIKSRSIT